MDKNNKKIIEFKILTILPWCLILQKAFSGNMFRMYVIVEMLIAKTRLTYNLLAFLVDETDWIFYK